MARGDKRQQIMQAAEAMFTTRRFHEITLDEVASAARVGKGTIYRYFQDKDDLFYQIVTGGLEEMCELLSSRVPADASFDEQLLGACRQISGFFERRRQLTRMMQAEEGRMTCADGPLRQRWMKRRRRLVEAVGRILARGVEEGEVRDDLPPQVLASFLLGMLRTRARDLADFPPRMREFEVVLDLFRHGAVFPGPREPAPPATIGRRGGPARAGAAT